MPCHAIPALRRRVGNQELFAAAMAGRASALVMECCLPAQTAKRALKKEELNNCLKEKAKSEPDRNVSKQVTALLQMVLWAKVARRLEALSRTRPDPLWTRTCFRRVSAKGASARKKKEKEKAGGSHRRLAQINASFPAPAPDSGSGSGSEESTFDSLESSPTRFVGGSAAFFRHWAGGRAAARHRGGYTPAGLLLDQEQEFEQDQEFEQEEEEDGKGAEETLDGGGGNTSSTRRGLQEAEERPRQFDYVSCLDKPLEVIRPVSTLLDEKRRFLECASQRRPGAALLSAADFEGAVHACVKPTGGISGQYLYRSMYAAQIQRCQRSIPPQRMLIVSSEELKANLTSTVRRVSMLSMAACRCNHYTLYDCMRVSLVVYKILHAVLCMLHCMLSALC
jgi:hypothetical protein